MSVPAPSLGWPPYPDDHRWFVALAQYRKCRPVWVLVCFPWRWLEYERDPAVNPPTLLYVEECADADEAHVKRRWYMRMDKQV